MGKRIIPLIVALVITFVSILLLVLGFVFSSDKNSGAEEYKIFAQKAERTQAKVVSSYNTRRWNISAKRMRTYTHFIVSYKVGDQQYKEDLGYYEGTLQVGDKLEILYDPEDPTHISYQRTDSEDTALTVLGRRLVIWGTIGLPAGLIGLAFILFRGRKKREV